jgi:nicotinic acid mononucleotide adenylyltransferase
MRRGSAREDVLDTLAALGAPGRRAQADVRFLEMDPVEVSSSMVRERVARAEPIDELVGADVAGYIAEHGLYRAPIEALR